MCGRATVVNPDGITEKVYGYTKKLVPSDWKPRYNLNPREEIPTVYYDPFLRQRVLRTMHWNLIPSKLESREKVDEFDSHYSTFNARIETVASVPTFQQAWRSQRLLNGPIMVHHEGDNLADDARDQPSTAGAD